MSCENARVGKGSFTSQNTNTIHNNKAVSIQGYVIFQAHKSVREGGFWCVKKNPPEIGLLLRIRAIHEANKALLIFLVDNSDSVRKYCF